MKVIEVLNKIANDELENGFKFTDENGSEWKYLRSEKRFCEINFATTDNVNGLNYHIERYFIPQKLNDEIEIIEEKEELIEKLNLFYNDNHKEYTLEDIKDKGACSIVTERATHILVIKINEIIDQLNELKKVGGKKE